MISFIGLGSCFVFCLEVSSLPHPRAQPDIWAAEVKQTIVQLPSSFGERRSFPDDSGDILRKHTEEEAYVSFIKMFEALVARCSGWWAVFPARQEDFPDTVLVAFPN